MEHEYLTTAEVAEMLRVSPSTVSRWCLEGRYPEKYLRRTNGNAKGSKWLIHRDALKPKEPVVIHRNYAWDERTRRNIAYNEKILESWRESGYNIDNLR